MSDVEMKIEVEAEDFTEELSDEALDREWVRVHLNMSIVCGGVLSSQ